MENSFRWLTGLKKSEEKSWNWRWAQRAKAWNDLSDGYLWIPSNEHQHLFFPARVSDVRSFCSLFLVLIVSTTIVQSEKYLPDSDADYLNHRNLDKRNTKKPLKETSRVFMKFKHCPFLGNKMPCFVPSLMNFITTKDLTIFSKHICKQFSWYKLSFSSFTAG